MKQTFEELIGQVAYSQHCSDMIEVIPKSKVIELLKQVRLSTLQECAEKAFAESSRSSITSKDKSKGSQDPGEM